MTGIRPRRESRCGFCRVCDKTQQHGWLSPMKKRGLVWGCRLLEVLGCALRRSGRDIKGLAKLATKFCGRRQVKRSTEVFRRCSIFRGMALDRPTQQPCSA